MRKILLQTPKFTYFWLENCFFSPLLPGLLLASFSCRAQHPVVPDVGPVALPPERGRELRRQTGVPNMRRRIRKEQRRVRHYSAYGGSPAGQTDTG